MDVMVRMLSLVLLLVTGSWVALDALMSAVAGPAPFGGSKQIASKGTLPQKAPPDDYSQGLPIAYYSIRGGLHTTLTLNNKGTRRLTPRLSLYSPDGQRHTVELDLAGRSFRQINLAEVAEAAGPQFGEGSLRVSYTGKAMELGGLLRMTNLRAGIEWDDSLMYVMGKQSNRLEAVWWAPPHHSQAKFVVTNTSGAELAANIRIGALGHEKTETISLGPWQMRVFEPPIPGNVALGTLSVTHSGPAGAVVARGLISDRDGYSTVVIPTDPASRKSNRLVAGGIRVGSVGGSRLIGKVAVRNWTDRWTQVTGVWHLPDARRVELATINLAPGELFLFDSTQEWKEATATMDGSPVASFEIQSTSAPGDIVVSAATVSENSKHVFRIPLVDPEVVPSSTGDYFWELDDSRHSVATITNLTDQPQSYNLIVRFEGGHWMSPIMRLDSHASTSIDIAEMQAQGSKDVRGRIIPLHVTRAQLHWSIMGGKHPRGLLGRMEQVDFEAGLSSTYYCLLPLNNIFDHVEMTPDQWDTLWVNRHDDGAYTVLEFFTDAFSNWIEEPIDITGNLNWSSSAPEVAQSLGSGVFGGVGPGQGAGIYAWGESQSWDGSTIEEFEPSHAPIDLSGYVACACNVPTNFRVVSNTKTGPNPMDMETVYTWDATDEAPQKSLDQCIVAELVEYDTWPWPFTAAPQNPTIGQVSGGNPGLPPGQVVGMIDRQKQGANGAFGIPISPVIYDDVFQTFRWKCPCWSSDWQNIQTRIRITRQVYSINGVWYYRVSKPGVQPGHILQQEWAGVQ